jgi:hypothetical protein
MIGELRIAKYSFSAAERYAVFTIPGEKCYMCNTAVEWRSIAAPLLKLLSNRWAVVTPVQWSPQG